MRPGDPVHTPYGPGTLLFGKPTIYGPLRIVRIGKKAYTLDASDVWQIDSVPCPFCQRIVSVEDNRTVAHYLDPELCPGSRLPLVLRLERLERTRYENHSPTDTTNKHIR